MSYRFEPINGPNELSSYLCPPISPLQSTVQIPQQLVETLSVLRQKSSHRMQMFERRLEDCLMLNRQSQSLMQQGCSRVKTGSSHLNLQRYEDLLHQNFRQIDWAKTSRVELNDICKQTSKQQLQHSIQTFQQELLETQNSHEEMLKELEAQLQDHIMEMTGRMDYKKKEVDNCFLEVRNGIAQMGDELGDMTDELGKNLSNSSQMLTSQLQNSIGRLEHFKTDS